MNNGNSSDSEPEAPTPSQPPRRSRGSGHVRIEDVARRAEVSAQTVSRYFRDSTLVSPGTSARIRVAAEALGYVPNLVAGSLASNRSRIVAILVPTIANPTHAAPVQGLTDAMRAERYQVLVGTTDYDAARERELVETFLGRRVDGLVITGRQIEPHAEQLLRRARVATVQLWELPEEPIDMAVGFSNGATGVAVADHLIARGYRSLAVVGHTAVTDTRSASRVSAFIERAVERGLDEPFVIGIDQPTAMGLTPGLLKRILDHTPAVDAVFCVSDQIAIGLLLACQRVGVAVPQRLAIVGFSDSDLASMVTPALTTIRVPRYELGRLAGAMLLQRFAGKTLASNTADVGFELVVRDST